MSETLPCCGSVGGELTSLATAALANRAAAASTRQMRDSQLARFAGAGNYSSNMAQLSCERCQVGEFCIEGASVGERCPAQRAGGEPIARENRTPLCMGSRARRQSGRTSRLSPTAAGGPWLRGDVLMVTSERCEMRPCPQAGLHALGAYYRTPGPF